ncbi:MAG: hypothetical protein D6711_12560 [Chloroflexi bacterium]|nr:MAG: hypothetical protein D6711_12560 [Chloroflexota bacterium]
MINETLIEQIPEKRQDADWLEANREEAFDSIRYLIENSETWEQAAESLLLLLPKLVSHPDFKRWGRLTEYAFRHSPYFFTNGFDGKATIEYASDFIFQKSIAPKQLPTKTIRRKRILTHHTQVLEIYLIILVGKYFNRVNKLDEKLVQEIIEFARMINQPDLNAKLYQILAYIYMYRDDADRTIRLGELAYHYYHPIGNHLEAGQSAYVVYIGYMMKGDYVSCSQWLSLAADEFAQTNYLKQHCRVSLAKSCMLLVMEKYEEAIQWGMDAAREGDLIENQNYIGLANTYVGLSHTYLGNWEQAEVSLFAAKEAFQKVDNQEELAHLELNIAFYEARRGWHDSALNRLDQTLAYLETLPESNWRKKNIDRAHQLQEHIRNNTVHQITPTSA